MERAKKKWATMDTFLRLFRWNKTLHLLWYVQQQHQCVGHQNWKCNMHESTHKWVQWFQIVQWMINCAHIWRKHTHTHICALYFFFEFLCYAKCKRIIWFGRSPMAEIISSFSTTLLLISSRTYSSIRTKTFRFPYTTLFFLSYSFQFIAQSFILSLVAFLFSSHTHTRHWSVRGVLQSMNFVRL